MAVRLKQDTLSKLIDAGYNTNVIRNDKIIGESTLQKIRCGKALLPEYVNTVCKLLKCQPGDIIEYVPDNAERH